MLVLALIGTRAQAIKMAPVVLAVRKRGMPCEIVLTGQHETTVDDLLADFGLKPDVRLWEAGEIKSMLRGLGWTVRVCARATRFFWRRRRYGEVVVLVHGDTMSTLVGAVAGRLAGCRVAHVEAGLRSGSMLDPFPEEVTRRLVTRLAQVAYCPGPEAMLTAAGGQRHCVDLGENTVLDALRAVVAPTAGVGDPTVVAPYVVVSAHRLETVYRTARLRALVELALALGERVQVRFVLHPVTHSRLERAGLMQPLQAAEQVELLPRMAYPSFIRLAAGAVAVLTDGGGNQEELAYLGVPTLILRRRTERPHGLDGNAVLAGLDKIRVLTALDRLAAWKRIAKPLERFAEAQPAARIADDLVAQTAAR